MALGADIELSNVLFSASRADKVLKPTQCFRRQNGRMTMEIQSIIIMRILARGSLMHTANLEPSHYYERHSGLITGWSMKCLYYDAEEMCSKQTSLDNIVKLTLGDTLKQLHINGYPKLFALDSVDDQDQCSTIF